MKAKCLTLAMLAVSMFAAGQSYADILDSKTFNSEDFAIGEILERDSVVYSTITTIAHPATVYPGAPGVPELPSLRYLYSLPYGTEVDSVIVTDWVEEVFIKLPNKLHPIQEPRDPFSQEEPPFVPPGPIYSQPGKYPDRECLAGAVVPVSFVRGAGIATIQVYPVRFDPPSNSLLLINSISFTITLRLASFDPFPPLRESYVVHQEFVSALGAVVENAGDLEGNLPPVEIMIDEDYAPGAVPPECVVITNAELAPAWVPYRDWMTKKGVPTETVSVEYIYNHPDYQAGDYAQKIHDYIRDRYHEDGLGYVLLGGNVGIGEDTGIVPKRICDPADHGILCDLYFAELGSNWDSDGDGIWGAQGDVHDVGADVLLARVPVENGQDIENWFTKRIRFETNPGNGDYSYLRKMIVSRADEPLDLKWWEEIGVAIPNYFDMDSTTLKEIPNGSSGSPTSPSGQDAVNALNTRVQIFQIMNHGGTEICLLRSRGLGGGWDTDWPLYAGDLRTIEAGKDHITFSLACALGNIDFDPFDEASECFAQIDLVSLGGSVAGRYNSRPAPLHIMTAGLDGITLYYLMQDELSITLSHYMGKLNFAQPNPPREIWVHQRIMIFENNIFGCPQMEAWTDNPHQFSINYPDHLHWYPHDPTIYCPEEGVDIQATEMVDGQPIPVMGALVTLWKDEEVYRRAKTNAAGIATLHTRAFSSGATLLTCTKHNFLPSQVEIPLQYGCVIDPDPPMERPGRGKAAVELPALIWNPLNFASGDSLHQSLLDAGYQSTLTDSLAPFMDSLSNYHIFVIGGMYEHGDWPLLGEPEIGPFASAIFAFLDGGGRLYWEGAVSYAALIDNGYDALFSYFYADPMLLVTYPYSFIRGWDGTFFEDIDSLGYNGGGEPTDLVWSYWDTIAEVIQAPEAGRNRGTNKATVYETGQTRTMLANFSWARLHDGYTNTRVDLIHNVMDWLSGTVDIEEGPGPAVPAKFSLSQNYPNPFNAATTIEYALPHATVVRLEVFDILGQRVATVIDGPKPAGYHRARWNAAGLPSGIYFARLRAGNYTAIKKMTLLK